MRVTAAGLSILLAMPGCHAKFKRAAPELAAVRAQLVTSTLPRVDLDYLQDGRLPLRTSRALRDTQAQRTEDQLEQAVNADAVHAAFGSGLTDTLGDGPPFGLTEDPAAPVLEVELRSVTLDVPALWRAGAVTMTSRIRLYEASGRRVYSAEQRCTAPIGEARPSSPAIYVSNARKQAGGVGSDELQAAFERAARACGAELIVRLRNHARPGSLDRLTRTVFEPDWGPRTDTP